MAVRIRPAVRDNLSLVAVVLLAATVVAAVVRVAPSDSERLQSFQAECAAAGFHAEQCAFLFKLSSHGRSADDAEAATQ